MATDENGDFDVKKQKEIANKFDTINKIKSNITNEFEEIISNSVNIAETFEVMKYKEVDS